MSYLLPNYSDSVNIAHKNKRSTMQTYCTTFEIVIRNSVEEPLLHSTFINRA